MPRSLSESCDRSEAKTILGKISDQLRRIACYLTNLRGNFNKIGLVAVDWSVFGQGPSLPSSKSRESV